MKDENRLRNNACMHTVLKLATVGVCAIVALQVIFYFVFQIIGYDSFWFLGEF